MERNRPRVATVLPVVAAAVLGLGGCAFPMDLGLGRSAGWFGFVEGGDLRAACGPGGDRDRYRLVHNRDFYRAVDIFEVDSGAGGPATLTATRVVGGTTSIVMTETTLRQAGFAGAVAASPATRVLGDDALAGFNAGFAAAAGMGPAPAGRRLRSDADYWVLSACRRSGRFGMQVHPGAAQPMAALTAWLEGQVDWARESSGHPSDDAAASPGFGVRHALPVGRWRESAENPRIFILHVAPDGLGLAAGY